MIPERERGYSVEADSVTVHERYQDHAPRAVRTSALGVSNIAKGRNLVACETCFPAPKARSKKEADRPPVGITTSDLPKTERALGSKSE